MSREIIAVYQDCVLCGDAGKKKVANFAKKGLMIRKVSFATPEGRELCNQAVFDYKIGGMPFFVCDGVFATNIDELLDKCAKKDKKKKGEKNGAGK